MARRNGIGDTPVERLVTDRVRELQYQAARKGLEPRHSVMIASNWSIAYGMSPCANEEPRQ